MKFSLIIAIYNVEKYLNDCLNSVCNQDLSFNEYEILCVNDGSSDQSRQIIEKFQAAFPQIKIINQKNSGVSSARNAGLKVAAGDYVWFIDGDDMIAENCLKKLYEILIKNDLNILCIDYVTINETYSHIKAVPLIHKNAELINAIGYSPTIWQKIIKREIITDYFYENLIYGEDDEFVFPLILKNMPIKKYNQVLYYYRERSSSVTHNNSHKINQLRIENTLWRINRFLKHKEYYEQFKTEKEINLIHTYEYNLYAVILINLAKMKPNAKQQKVYFDQLKALGVYPYPIQWKRLFAKNSFKSYKMRIHRFLAESGRLFLPIKPYFFVFNFFYYFYLNSNNSIGD